jgi:hypothetical protein
MIIITDTLHNIKSYPDLKIKEIIRRSVGKMYSGINRYIRYEKPVFDLTVNFKNISEIVFIDDLEHFNLMFASGQFLLVLPDDDYKPAINIKKYLAISSDELLVFDCIASSSNELSPSYKNWSEPLSRSVFKITANVIDDPFALFNNFIKNYIITERD